MLPVFDLFGLKIFSYPFFIGIAWAIGYVLSNHLNKSQKTPLKKFDLLFFLLFVTSFAGSKLAYLFNLNEYKSLLTSTSFWLGGGFVFYGGVLFSLITIFVYKIIYKRKWSDFSFFIPIICLSHAIGRIGCLLAGCCYGTKTETFWSVYLHGHERHPTQIYEALFLALSSVYFYHEYKKEKKHMLIKYLVSYGLFRFLMEFLRGDLIRGVYQGLSFSQYISLALVGVSLLVLVVERRVLRRR